MKASLVPMALAALVVAAIAVAAAPAAAQDDVYEHTIELHEFENGGMHAFPEQINANQGDTLKFIVTNPEENTVSHDLVVCAEAPKPEATCAPENKLAFTPSIAPGETREITFTVDEAGTFEYYCQVVGHKTAPPGMKGTLVVAGGAADVKESPSLALMGGLVALAGAALVIGRR